MAHFPVISGLQLAAAPVLAPAALQVEAVTGLQAVPGFQLVYSKANERISFAASVAVPVLAPAAHQVEAARVALLLAELSLWLLPLAA